MSADITPEDAMVIRFHAYCRKAINNAANEAFRSIRRNTRFEIQLSALPEEIADPHDPYALIAAEFQVGDWLIPIWDGDLADALTALATDQREVVLRYFFIQQTEEDIAKVIGKTQRTVSNIKKRALRFMKKYMED